MFRVLNEELLAGLHLTDGKRFWAILRMPERPTEARPMLLLGQVGQTDWIWAPLSMMAAAFNVQTPGNRGPAMPLSQWIERLYSATRSWLTDDEKKKLLLQYLNRRLVPPDGCLPDGLKLSCLECLTQMKADKGFAALLSQLEDDRILWTASTSSHEPASLTFDNESRPFTPSLLIELRRAIAAQRRANSVNRLTNLDASYLAYALERHWATIFADAQGMNAMEVQASATGVLVRGFIRLLAQPSASAIMVEPEPDRLKVTLRMCAPKPGNRTEIVVIAYGGPATRPALETAKMLREFLAPYVADALWSVERVRKVPVAALI